jgi:predicted  nucleic acid-binding Zn-ribbon protein
LTSSCAGWRAASPAPAVTSRPSRRRPTSSTSRSHELAQQLQQTKAHLANLENEVASADARVNHLREQMNSVKTNKEYSAMLVEVNTLKADKGKVEDQAMVLMEQVEKLEGELAEVSAAIEEQAKIQARADADLAERTGEVGDRLDEVKAERQQRAAAVPPDVLEVFERMADSYDGEAMAPIVEQDRRRMEYLCGGCYMNLPVEMVNKLIRADELTRCTSCQRILFIEQELRETMGAK